MGAELTVIRWRDIPAQVIARSGRQRATVPLSDRFQEAIDTAATRVGLTAADDYMTQWHRDSRPCGDDLEAEAHAEAARLESTFGADELEVLAASGGVGGAGLG